MKIIDPHLHLFNLEQGEYQWLKADKPPFWPDKTTINKSFTEQSLKLSSPLSLTAFVHIEAGFDNQQPWRELNYLQKCCQLPFTAVASIDLNLDNTSFSQQLEKLTHQASFIGVRHILDELASDLLTSKQVLSNLTLLNGFAKDKEYKLNFEVQMPLDDQLGVNALCNVIANNRNLTFIINHAGFPTTKTDSIEWEKWQANLTKLALFSHVVIKCSGWEMIDRQYQHQHDWLNHNLQTCFTAFGKKRMMLASNFPLCLFTHNSYQDYWQELLGTDFLKDKTNEEKSALCYYNALHYYQLKI